MAIRVITEQEINEQKEYIQKLTALVSNKKYYLMTMGCQLNESESEKISGMVEEMGYTKTENQEEADLVIFNTCCIRENAEEKLFGKLRRVKKTKKSK